MGSLMERILLCFLAINAESQPLFCNKGKLLSRSSWKLPDYVGGYEFQFLSTNKSILSLPPRSCENES